MVELIFETHSISTDNERGIATGWNQGRLSAQGNQLAAELGRRDLIVPPAVVFTSDLARAVETAEIAFGPTGITVQRDARLRECNYGELNGRPAEEIEEQRADRIDSPFPGGESYRQVAHRVGEFLAELSETWEGQRVVVIGHAATKWALDLLLDGVPFEQNVNTPFEWQEGWHYTVP